MSYRCGLGNTEHNHCLIWISLHNDISIMTILANVNVRLKKGLERPWNICYQKRYFDWNWNPIPICWSLHIINRSEDVISSETCKAIRDLIYYFMQWNPNWKQDMRSSQFLWNIYLVDKCFLYKLFHQTLIILCNFIPIYDFQYIKCNYISFKMQNHKEDKMNKRGITCP